MPFEAFNHVGRWRATEKDKPVDTSGSISFTADATIEGDVQGVREMMEKLASSKLVRQSFIRHVFDLDGTQRNAQRFENVNGNGQVLRRKRRKFQGTPGLLTHVRFIPV